MKTPSWNNLLILLFLVHAFSCQNKEHKKNEFIFKLVQDENSEKFGTFRYAERPFCSYLKVFLGRDEQGAQMSFNANILKDGSEFYLLYPQFDFGDQFDTINVNGHYVWYKFLFLDCNLKQSETRLSKKRTRICDNDSINFIKQNIILKMERKISVLNTTYYLFSQSFGYNCFFSNPGVKLLIHRPDKPEPFVKFYFVYSDFYGFKHLPTYDNSVEFDSFRIPFFEDNSIIYNLKVD